MNPLPQGFLEYIGRFPQLAPLAQALTTEPAVAVRLNSAKTALRSGTVLEAIDDADRVQWCNDGFYLSERPQFTFDPALHQGMYYVQDPSSMCIAPIVQALIEKISTDDRRHSTLRYLDACAAPGGKTTAALSQLPDGSLMVANEYDFKRAAILAENLAKWGSDNVVVTRGDTGQFAALPGFFDIVAVDAPCSGEGMMRKEPKAVEQWSPALVNDCASTQRRIIENVWQALRPGGFMVYSTCTFNRTENEENLQWIVDTFGGEPVSINQLDGIVGIERGIDCRLPCYRFIPGRIRGEGLFVAVVRKPDDRDTDTSIPSRQGKPQPADKKFAGLASWFRKPMLFVADGNEVYAVPAALSIEIAELRRRLNVISCGVHAASVKGRDLVPAHALALSNALAPDAFPRVEIDPDTAIRYLQRESITLPTDTAKGCVLLMHAGSPLGFVKNLGNRANNLLPKNWRILSRR